MKNTKLVEQLEKDYRPEQEISIELDFPLGIGETNYHRGTWRGFPFTCTSSIGWKRGSLKATGMDVSDLITILKDKELSEMSGEDFNDLELVEMKNGSTDVSDVEWEETPPEEDLEELDVMDLYNDSEITDCEYGVSPGTIGSLTIEIGRDTLVINADGYDLNQTPRIREWTAEGKAKFESQTIVAIAGMMEVQSTYDLLLESGITENLPEVQVEAHEAPALRVRRFEVESETDVLGNEVVSLVVWAENGPAFRLVVTSLGDAIRLRNQLARRVDGFGRGYMQGLEVDEAYEPTVMYDFGEDDEEEG